MAIETTAQPDLLDATPRFSPEGRGVNDRAAAPPESAEAKRRRSMRPLLELAPYLVRHRGMLAAAFVAMVVSAGATLALPMGVRRMIDFGFSGSNGTFINQYFAMILGVGVLLAMASSARFYCVNWLGERVVADLRADVFAHVARLGPSFYETTRSGEVMSRLTADTMLIKGAAGSAVSQTLRNLVMLIGALIMMVVTSGYLTGLVLIAIPAIMLPMFVYGRSVRRLSREAQDSLADVSAYAAENIGAVRTMQAFTNETRVSARFAAGVEHAFNAALNRMRARAGLTAIAITLVFASVVGVLWIGAHEVIAGAMTGGRLGQFVLYAVFAAGAVAELSEVWGEIQQAAGAAERLSELLALVPEIRSPLAPVPLPSLAHANIGKAGKAEPLRGELEFREVSFAYKSRPGISALRNVSFHVKPGETVAIVGPSGAGKSTIFNLALRFYDANAGAVLIDGVPTDAADLECLRRRFALVPQEIALFADTIAENIRYGSGDASREDVEAAAQAAQAAEFIRDLPHGYDTKIGERGVTLSGGQRQRIAVARAILRDAPILLLDEATSALDAQSERLVQQGLERLMANRTTLVIAHRLATVQKADRILVLDQGTIIEQGSHAELIAKDGLYRQLSQLQFRVDAQGV